MAKINRPVVVVRNVLVDDRGCLLLGLRKQTGLWELPGGKVDDERLAAAGKREQREETGVELKGCHVCLGHFEGRGVSRPDRRYIDFFLLWERWKGFPRRIEPEVHTDWSWFAPDDLPPAKELMPSTAYFVRNFLPDVLAGKAEEAAC
jgi:8-oxo-dGTP pyrophosphatase MutT (NUDIX family)